MDSTSSSSRPSIINKAKRSSNFSSSEISAIIDGVVKRKNIINGSLSSSVSSQAKKRAWDGVAVDVRAVGGVSRSVDEIKKKWSNIKVLNKKRGAFQRLEANKTGGGEAPQVLDDECQKVLSAIGDAAIYGIEGGLESTTSYCEESKSEHRWEGLKFENVDEFETGFRFEPEAAVVVETVIEKPKSTEGELISILKKLVDVEEERCQIEKERLDIEKQRLEIEKHKLQM